jgi:hypothetical protein
MPAWYRYRICVTSHGPLKHVAKSLPPFQRRCHCHPRRASGAAATASVAGSCCAGFPFGRWPHWAPGSPPLSRIRLPPRAGHQPACWAPDGRRGGGQRPLAYRRPARHHTSGPAAPLVIEQQQPRAWHSGPASCAPRRIELASMHSWLHNAPGIAARGISTRQGSAASKAGMCRKAAAAVGGAAAGARSCTCSGSLGAAERAIRAARLLPGGGSPVCSKQKTCSINSLGAPPALQPGAAARSQLQLQPQRHGGGSRASQQLPHTHAVPAF